MEMEPNPIYSSSSTIRKRNVQHRDDVYSSYIPSTTPSDSSNNKTFQKKVVRNLDLFPKVEKDLTVSTERGGLVSLIGYSVIAVLLLTEVLTWMNGNRTTEEHLVVDTSLGKKMPINLNITFHAIHCDNLHLDAMDVAGDSQIDIEDTLVKKRHHEDGSPLSHEEEEASVNQKKLEHDKKEAAIKSHLVEGYCGSCFGAEEEEGQCCSTCDELAEAYKKKKWGTAEVLMVSEQCVREGRAFKKPDRMKKGEGCNLSGFMSVNRVAGNFHLAIGEGVERDGKHIHTFMPDDVMNFNSSHVIHELSFGPKLSSKDKGGLDGVEKIVTLDNGGTGMIQYFLKIVPTIYKGKDKETQETNRFFFTERFRPYLKDFLTDEHLELGGEDEDLAGHHTPGGGSHTHAQHHSAVNSILPGIFFIYEIYPFAVEIRYRYVSFTHLFIRMAALVGGGFTIMGWVDSMLYAREKRGKGARGKGFY